MEKRKGERRKEEKRKEGEREGGKQGRKKERNEKKTGMNIVSQVEKVGMRDTYNISRRKEG